MRKITAQFANGDTVTRQSEAPYVYAARRDSSDRATFHRDHAAAHRRVGRYGEIVRTDVPVVNAEPEFGTWTVHYADGETRQVTPTMRTSPMAAGKAARPGVAIIRASKNRS